VKEISAGDLDRERFASEIMTYLNHLYRVAYHLVRSADEAQDCVQETFTRALGARNQFAPGTNLKAWLTRILYNLSIDAYARNRRMVSAEALSEAGEQGTSFWETQPTSNPGPETLVLEQELGAKISDALKQMPEEFRAPIVLVDMGDMSYAQVAEVLSCPIGTVRSRLSRGRKLMEKQLRGYVKVTGTDPNS
jgi:RNA polymerase sigma-70 factor (ECF subfamily)